MIHKIALPILLIASAMSLCLFTFSLPQIGTGMWHQSETAIAALHLCGSIAALGLLLLSFTSSITAKALRHPLVIIPASLAILSLILSPFHELPIRNLLGSTRTGEGAIWWLDITTLSASMIILWRVKFYRKALICIAFGSAILCYAGTFLHNIYGLPYTPYYFNDYLAYLILCLAPLCWSWLKNNFKSSLAFIVFYIGLNALLYFTNNKAMIAFGFTVPPFIYILSLIQTKSINIAKHLKWLALILLPPCVIFSFYMITILGGIQGFYSFNDSGIFITLASRAYLIHAGIEPLIHHPVNFLIGTGWGTFVEHITRYLPIDWLKLTDFSSAQWDGMRDDHFHTHNMYIETLNATGVIGLALLYIFYISIYRYSKKTNKDQALLLALGLTSWASLWFMFPLHAPYLCFAIASSCKMSYVKMPRLIHQNAKPIIIVALFIALALQATTSYIAQDTAISYRKNEPQKLEITDASSFNQMCKMTYRDFSAGGIQLARMLLNRTRYLETITNEELREKAKIEMSEEDLKPENIRKHLLEINHIFCQAQNYIKNSSASSIQLNIALLMARGEILLGFDALLTEQENKYYLSGWQESLNTWLDIAPTRTDQAIPFLLFNIIHNKEENSKELLTRILDNNAQDPVALWFMGLKTLNDPDKTQEGLSMLKAALNNGIERLMPIDEQLLSDLKSIP